MRKIINTFKYGSSQSKLYLAGAFLFGVATIGCLVATLVTG